MNVLESGRRWRKPLVDPLPDGLFEILCGCDQDRLDRWVAGATADELRHVFEALGSRSLAVVCGRVRLFKALATHSPLIPGLLVVEISRNHDLIPRFLGNANLSDVHVTIARSMLNNALLDLSWPIDLVRRCLDALYRRGAALPPEVLHRTLRTYERAKYQERESGGWMRSQAALVRRALEVMAVLPEVSESDIRFILTEGDCPTDFVGKFVRHPNSGPDVWRLLVNDLGAGTFEAAAPALAHHPPALEVEDVRERLLASDEPEVLAGLLECGVEPSSIFSRLLGISPRAALRALAAAPLQVRRSIAPKQLLPLLRVNDAHIRARTMRLLGTVGSAGTPGRDEQLHDVRPTHDAHQPRESNQFRRCRGGTSDCVAIESVAKRAEEQS